MRHTDSQSKNRSHGLPWLLAVLLFLGAALPSSASMLRRASLEYLVENHPLIVVAEVTETVSYWSDDGSMIFTDVTVRPDTMLKGRAMQEPVTLTLLGGTVDDTTVAISAGARLYPGESYLLFLGESSLKQGRSAWTVREHSQGVFDIQLDEQGELRVLSQARTVHLVQDRQGQVDPPGGQKGLAKNDIFDAILGLVAKGDQ